METCRVGSGDDALCSCSRQTPSRWSQLHATAACGTISNQHGTAEPRVDARHVNLARSGPRARAVKSVGSGSKSLASHRGSPDSHRVIAIGRSSEAVGGAKSRVEAVEGGQVDRRRGEVLRGEIKVKTGDAQRSPGAGEESSRGR